MVPCFSHSQCKYITHFASTVCCCVCSCMSAGLPLEDCRVHVHIRIICMCVCTGRIRHPGIDVFLNVCQNSFASVDGPPGPFTHVCKLSGPRKQSKRSKRHFAQKQLRCHVRDVMKMSKKTSVTYDKVFKFLSNKNKRYAEGCTEIRKDQFKGFQRTHV